MVMSRGVANGYIDDLHQTRASKLLCHSIALNAIPDYLHVSLHIELDRQTNDRETHREIEER